MREQDVIQPDVDQPLRQVGAQVFGQPLEQVEVEEATVLMVPVQMLVLK